MNDLLTRLQEKQEPIVVVGLGYVGLPLACLLAKKFRVIGFDIDPTRVKELTEGTDRTGEVESHAVLTNPLISYTSDPKVIGTSRFVVVAVPTPVDKHKKPDLTPLIMASRSIGQYMAPGSIIVFESTVFPGCTENECCTEIERVSGFVHKKDFFLGYSPERVNPGDKEHTVERINKVVSASTPEALEVIAAAYGAVITAELHRAPSIATAEAAKVIENTQRDLNIALINELAMIFERIGLDTQDVLKAAGTKWNFLNFQPGLVGGHCIGVDPYYLTHLAEGVGINPQVISAGRRINDNMATFVAEKTIKLILSKKPVNQNLKIAVLGVTFKENVPDLRNSKVIDVVEHLEKYGATVLCVDPVCDAEEYSETYGRKLHTWDSLPVCDAVIFAVKHKAFVNALTLDVLASKLESHHRVLIDLKGHFDRSIASEMNLTLWRL